MNKTFMGLAFTMLLLAGCEEPRQYEKMEGEVIGTYSSSGRYGTSFYIKVSYPISDGKFVVDGVYVGDNEKALDEYDIHEKVDVFVDEDGIGEITKKLVDKNKK